MNDNENYQALAARLDSFPQRFPSTASGVEFKLLAQLFTASEAGLAAKLSLAYTPLDESVTKSGISKSDVRSHIKSMAGKGLINIKHGDKGLSVRLLPFIVGFYENQVSRMDETFANLFEEYYREANHDLLSVTPQFHRIIPVNETVNDKVEILPEDNVIELLSAKSAWGVMDCICRKQKALIGEGCDHPVRVCLVLSETPNAFEGIGGIEALGLDGALDVLDQAAAAGLVHTVSNNKGDISYVCNCCTCSCGILRGIAEAHIANVVARSAYLAQVSDDICTGCGICEGLCQFDAITILDVSNIDPDCCVGCGVCVRACPEDAISLSMRLSEEILPVPNSFEDWLEEREKARSNY
ncbi:MAG: 4Fe-4S binding protein [Chloroflexota bacterium]|nr:4Fe-4S binding protein [Chloroflexota bacterium]